MGLFASGALLARWRRVSTNRRTRLVLSCDHRSHPKTGKRFLLDRPRSTNSRFGRRTAPLVEFTDLAVSFPEAVGCLPQPRRSSGSGDGCDLSVKHYPSPFRANDPTGRNARVLRSGLPRFRGRLYPGALGLTSDRARLSFWHRLLAYLLLRSTAKTELGICVGPKHRPGNRRHFWRRRNLLENRPSATCCPRDRRSLRVAASARI